jgi:hypothetical protein
MKKIDKAINLQQLDNELNGMGLNCTNDDTGNLISISLTENNTASQAQLQSAIDSHLAVFKQPTIIDKLASVGLSIEDLRAALGV